MLMNMMKAYYNKPVILLIDEYDVPIAKASSNGYYKEMLEVMKAMLSTALKITMSVSSMLRTTAMSLLSNAA